MQLDRTFLHFSTRRAIPARRNPTTATVVDRAHPVLSLGCQTALDIHHRRIAAVGATVASRSKAGKKVARAESGALRGIARRGPLFGHNDGSLPDAFAPFLLALGLVASSWMPASAAAQRRPQAASATREHRVRAGQNLARIARRYALSVETLAAANRLRPDSPLQLGQRLTIPVAGTIGVRRGDTVESLARRHGVSAEDLREANHLRAGATLQAGQALVLPGSLADRTPASRWGRPRRPGVATLTRLATHRTAKVRLVDRRGVVRREALRDLARLLAPRHGGGRKEPHPRLVRLLARVSDHFGGRPVEIVSGVRPAGGFTRRESRHVAGEAIDFRIRGVPNTDLRDFCKSFDNVGVGYYPNSLFVHLDVRRESATWTDFSRPGEAPVYTRAGSAAGTPDEGDGGRGARDDAEAGGEPESADDGAAPVDDAPGELSDD